MWGNVLNYIHGRTTTHIHTFCINLISLQVNGIRWHQCTYCAKEFKKPSDLVRHIRIHTHEKPYKCRQCFRAFAVKSTLTAHIKTHTGVKDFRCEVCTKMFSTQGSLKVHLRLHTGMLFLLLKTKKTSTTPSYSGPILLQKGGSIFSHNAQNGFYYSHRFSWGKNTLI